jgi:hypothetical protein
MHALLCPDARRLILKFQYDTLRVNWIERMLLACVLTCPKEAFPNAELASDAHCTMLNGFNSSMRTDAEARPGWDVEEYAASVSTGRTQEEIAKSENDILGQELLAGTADPSRAATVAERLLSVTFLVATSLVDEEVGTIEDTDIGARVGLRWPRGPFEMINKMGIKPAGDLVGQYGGHWGVAVPGNLSLQWRANVPFEFSYVKSEVADGIATLTVNRPDAMNALNETVAPWSLEYEQMRRLLPSALNQLLAQRSLRPV